MVELKYAKRSMSYKATRKDMRKCQPDLVQATILLHETYGEHACGGIDVDLHPIIIQHNKFTLTYYGHWPHRFSCLT